MNSLEYRQHQQEVGWLKQNHDILDKEVDDFIKFHKPLNMTHVYRPIFQAESDFRGFVTINIFLSGAVTIFRM